MCQPCWSIVGNMKEENVCRDRMIESVFTIKLTQKVKNC
jgi:hypothetical protein